MKIIVDNNEIEVNDGLRLKKLVEDNKDIVGAIVNQKVQDLNYYVDENDVVSWIYRESETGLLMKERTLSFLLIVATKLLYPSAEIRVEHTLSSCLYCRIDNLEINDEIIQKIQSKMQELVVNKECIHRTRVKTSDAITFFKEHGMQDKADLLKYRISDKSSIYELCGIYDYFYGIMYIDLSYVKEFYLHLYKEGVLLGSTSTFKDQTKLYEVFHEYEKWGRKVGVSTVAELNQSIVDNNYTNLVLMSEAMIEKNLANTVKQILASENKKKIVLIAGPSSAGKTTFSKRLGIQFRLEGIKPIILAMDDFYLNREDTPKLPDGSYDFESIEAVDLPLFNKTINDLLKGKKVNLPRFDFMSGKRGWYEDVVSLDENSILIVEGIHALNPRSSSMIEKNAKFKIYINALTHLNLDSHNRISTSDYRMIRRIVRDYQFRGNSATKTIDSWHNVEMGEHNYIYPYQEEADIIFNTSMIYEMAILKKIALKLLQQIQKEESQYLEANRLCNLLNYFLDGDETNVPRNSILAEFIGNSVFF